MSRNITFAAGEFYHLYNRGVDKRNIFLNKKDYERFLSLLYLANDCGRVDIKVQAKNLQEALILSRGETLVDIGAYVLMPNHFHLLVKEKTDGGISAFMQKVNTGYTMYFNKRNERTGALFQGTFKAKRADSDEYLKYLISYIHLNPVKLREPTWKETGIRDRQGARDYLHAYTHSSYLDFLGVERSQKRILGREAFPDYFTALRNFEEQVEQWLNHKLS